MAKAKPAAQMDNGTTAAAAAMMATYPVAAKAWMDVLSEGARFMTDRLRQDMETQRALLSCGTPAELLRLQSEFVTTAMQQYAEETTRLVSMMTEAVKDSAEEASRPHKRGYDDVPL